MARKVLRLMSTGGIGDAILTTPVIRALKERDPGCKLVVVCIPRTHVEVYKHNPHIDVLKFAGPRVFVKSPLANLIHQARTAHRLETGKFVINMWGGTFPGLWSASNVTEIIAERLNIPLSNRQLEIFLTPAEDEKAGNYLSQYSNVVAIHVTPHTSSNKTWPAERWTALVRKNSALTFIQLGAAEDASVKGAVDLRGKTSLRETFAIIKHAKSFVGVDSGLAHAAAAFGTPGVVLFGPSSPLVLGHDGNVNLYKALRCSPCIEILVDALCPYGKPCMNGILADEVSQALRAQLHGSNAQVQARASASSFCHVEGE